MSPSPSPPPRKRPRQALFLTSDDEGDHSDTRANPPPINIDLDDIFGSDIDIDDNTGNNNNYGKENDAALNEVDKDDPFYVAPISADLDIEALQRAARARHKHTRLDLAPILPSSSPPRDEPGGSGGRGAAQFGGKSSKDGEKKERKKVMRLDEGLLLGPTGIPQLIKDTKGFRIKGKGHEAEDLTRFLQVYQFWSHKMYPKSTFRDTVDRVEKLCHSRRMNVKLSVWRDEFHGKKPARDPLLNGSDDDDDDDDGRGNNVNKATDATSDNDDNTRMSSPNASSDADIANNIPRPPPSSRPPSSVASSSGPVDDFDDFDIEALLLEEDQTRNRLQQAQTGPPSTSANVNPSVDDPMNEDEDEAFWRELDEGVGNPPPIPPPATPPRSDATSSTNTGVSTHQSDNATLPKVSLLEPPEPMDEDYWGQDLYE